MASGLSHLAQIKADAYERAKKNKGSTQPSHSAPDRPDFKKMTGNEYMEYVNSHGRGYV